MAFLHLPLLALGTLGLLAPILLHLAMRRKPQHAFFPALRFIRKRQVVNERRMRIRHWLLLALRCLGLLAIGAALARPVVASSAASTWILVGMLAIAFLVLLLLSSLSWQQRRGSLLTSILLGMTVILGLALAGLLVRAISTNDAIPTLDTEAPVAAVLLFDTSPRMDLVHESKSRLEVAKELAHWLISQLPQDSRIAVMDTNIGGTAFAVDRSAAKTEVNALQSGFAAQSLPNMIDAANQLLNQAEEEEQQQQQQEEIYIFTDLTLHSWRSAETLTMGNPEPATEAPHVYVLDVGVVQPRNLALGDVRLSRQHLAQNAKLNLNVELFSQGISGARQIDLLLETPDPDLPIIVDGQPRLPETQLRDQREFSFVSDESQRIDFALSGLNVGTHHGQIRISGSDGLPVDDTRFFSVEVHPPFTVAVVTGPGADARFLMESLAPYKIRATGQALFDCRLVGAAQVRTTNWNEFDCVALLDPSPLSPMEWQRMEDFVQQGGGLGVFLGRNLKIDAFNGSSAQRVLPGQIARPWVAGTEDILFSLGTTQHPVTEIMRQNATSIPWNEFPVFRHWQLEKLVPSAQVLIRFSNGQPAIIESRVGSGRVVTITTPFSDPLNVRGRPPWNRGTDSWPFFVLANEIFKYLAQGNESPLNYDIAQTARLSHRQNDAQLLQWFRPEGTWQDAMVSGREITIAPRTPGTYRLKGTPPSEDSRGFSANLPAQQTNLSRVKRDQLDAFFGEGNYQLARDQQTIHRHIGVARRGHEFYPWLLLFVVLILALEHLLSNRFYAISATTASPSARNAEAGPNVDNATRPMTRSVTTAS